MSEESIIELLRLQAEREKAAREQQAKNQQQAMERAMADANNVTQYRMAQEHNAAQQDLANKFLQGRDQLYSKVGPLTPLGMSNTLTGAMGRYQTARPGEPGGRGPVVNPGLQPARTDAPSAADVASFMKSSPKGSAENQAEIAGMLSKDSSAGVKGSDATQGQLADILSGAGANQAIDMNVKMGAESKANERDSRQRAAQQGQDLAEFVSGLGASDRDYKRRLDSQMANTIAGLISRKSPALKKQQF